jgi:hypothetical protein
VATLAELQDAVQRGRCVQLDENAPRLWQASVAQAACNVALLVPRGSETAAVVEEMLSFAASWMPDPRSGRAASTVLGFSNMAYASIYTEPTSHLKFRLVWIGSTSNDGPIDFALSNSKAPHGGHSLLVTFPGARVRAPPPVAASGGPEGDFSQLRALIASGRVFDVSEEAVVQHRSRPEELGRLIAQAVQTTLMKHGQMPRMPPGKRGKMMVPKHVVAHRANAPLLQPLGDSVPGITSAFTATTVDVPGRPSLLPSSLLAPPMLPTIPTTDNVLAANTDSDGSSSSGTSSDDD